MLALPLLTCSCFRIIQALVPDMGGMTNGDLAALLSEIEHLQTAI